MYNLCKRSVQTVADVSNTCQASVSVYHAQTMYNIKQAAARAGVSVPVLRAWERRYGIVNPARSTGGYRQFDDNSIARVRTMRALVDEGWSPSGAAAAILDGSVPVQLQSASSAGEVVSEAVAGGAVRGTGPAEAVAMTERFLGAARALDPDAITAVLDDIFARGSFERIATDLLFPAWYMAWWRTNHVLRFSFLTRRYSLRTMLQIWSGLQMCTTLAKIITLTCVIKIADYYSCHG